MRVTLTGTTGFVGSRLVEALRARDDEVTVLSRDAGSRERAPRRGCGRLGLADPAGAGRCADRSRRRRASCRRTRAALDRVGQGEIRASRERGTRQLVAGLAAADPRPARLIDEPIRFDTVVGLGVPPDVRLQRALRTRGEVTALDRAVTVVYGSWSLPHALLAYLLVRHVIAEAVRRAEPLAAPLVRAVARAVHSAQAGLARRGAMALFYDSLSGRSS